MSPDAYDNYNNPYTAIQLNAGALELPYKRLLVESRPDFFLFLAVF